MSKRDRSRRWRRLAEVLPGLARSWQLDQALLEQRIASDWPAIVGERLAQHTRALSIEHCVLLIAVDNPVWMTQLVFLKPKLMAKLMPRLPKGVVKDIRFEVRDS